MIANQTVEKYLDVVADLNRFKVLDVMSLKIQLRNELRVFLW